MRESHSINVRDLIDSRSLTGFQRLLVLFGFLIIVMDGFDAVIMGFIAPQLKLEWQVSPQSLGAILSAGLIGQAVGALLAGPLADRYGRKVVLVTSVASFGACTFLTALASDVTLMVVLRFLTGLGLGAAIPNTSTLVAEYSPERTRSFLVTLALCGFTCGAASGGFLSAWMIPSFGWQSVLVLGGVLPVAMALILIVWMPESLNYLVTRSSDHERIRKAVRRLAPDVETSGASFNLGRAPMNERNSIAIVLSPPFRFGTICLWAGYFLLLFLIYLLSSWLPTLITEGERFTVSEAAIATAMFQIGGQAGSLAAGWAMDRWEKSTVLGIIFLVGSAAIFAVGQATEHYLMLCTIAFFVGFCMIGGSVGMNALAAHFYPTEARSTGASWMIGIGRLGAILSAFAGAEILSLGWSLSTVFTALVVPGLLTAIMLFAFGRNRSAVKHRPLKAI
ncbi:MFS transporter [Sinorhizobium medicae]|uniref:4-hydroxybenzoate transporter PcaK n=1 Tax=Sinorhizobium medicae TaxID=110321 RepID=A0A508XB97_9HYPH|nr:aromatic acid/H+ symport family MFS transporter [Sinorhizobium medicae]VTZ65458.1 4-hydroxybenzoate transporter PcaK [Sinorhizobium medicae]